jgi:hypothetical protein
MSLADNPGADPNGSGQANELPDEVHTQLVEALVHLLIEKGVLTKNDALSIVQTVVQVQRGAAIEGRHSDARTEATLQMLKRMYRSFQAVKESPGLRQASFDNVLQLRPPIHGDRPEFPGDD